MFFNNFFLFIRSVQTKMRNVHICATMKNWMSYKKLIFSNIRGHTGSFWEFLIKKWHQVSNFALKLISATQTVLISKLWLSNSDYRPCNTEFFFIGCYYPFESQRFQATFKFSDIKNLLKLGILKIEILEFWRQNRIQ